MQAVENEKNRIYKREFVSKLACKTGMDKQLAAQAVDAFLDTLVESWSKKQDVCIRGFGVFEIHSTSERPGRNPKTMEDALILGGYKPIFHPSRGLRSNVNQNIKAAEKLKQEEAVTEEAGGSHVG